MRSLGAGIIVVLCLLVAAQAAGQAAWNAFPQGQLRLGVGVGRSEGFGARSLGMAGAFSAVADDATAALWNPAGMAKIERHQIQFGASYIDNDVTRGYSAESLFTSTEALPFRSYTVEASTAATTSFEPEFATYAFPVWNVELTHNLVLGFSYFQAESFVDEYLFENTSRFSQDGQLFLTWGSYENEGFGTVVDRSVYDFRQSGQTDYFSLTAAYSYQDTLFLGVTISRLDGSRDIEGNMELRALRQNTYFVENDQLDLDRPTINTGTLQNIRLLETWSSDYSGVLATLGFLWRGDDWTLGLTYRPQMEIDYNYSVANANSTFDADGIESSHLYRIAQPGQPDTLVYDHIAWAADGATTFDMPQMWSIGLAYEGIDYWIFAVDYSSSDWSETTVSIDDGGQSIEYYYPSLMKVSDAQNNYGGEQYRDTTLRIGFEGIPYREDWELLVRGGYYTEKAASGIPGAGQPKIDGYSLGLGFLFGDYFLDLAVIYDTTKVDLPQRSEYSDEDAFMMPNAYLNYDSSGYGFYTYDGSTTLLGGSYEKASWRAMLSFGFFFGE
jgi:long-subunit fatty acid transport protein